MIEEKRFPATGMPDQDWWQALWPAPAATLRAVGIATHDSVVDLCCGDGYFTSALSQLVEPGHVFGVDLDPAMLQQAKAVCHQVGNCTFLEGDARELQDRISAPIDVVLIANTFHGVPDKTGLAQTIHSVLKPGGRFIVINWHARAREETTVLGQPRGPATPMRMSPEALAAVVTPAGFELTEVVELPPYHYGAIFRRTSA